LAKTFILENQNDANGKGIYDLCFGKRPPEQLYDMRHDPRQLRNLAEDPKYAKIKQELAARLEAELRALRSFLGIADTFRFHRG